jgi:putative hydrolase of the HAD superfamily
LEVGGWRLGIEDSCEVKILPMPLDTVFLDAGGVLVFPNWGRVSDALARHGVRADPQALADAEPYAKRKLDVGETIKTTNDASRGWLYFDLILSEAGIPLSDATRAALTDLSAYHREHNLWELVPSTVLPVLEALRARGLRLTVVSNANGTLCAHMERLGLTHCLDCVLDSQDLGVEKPDPRLFEIALERSSASPAKTIHVGDLYNVDVVGARSAGIRGVLLDEAGLYADADCPRVRSLAELVTRIDAGAF